MDFYKHMWYNRFNMALFGRKKGTPEAPTPPPEVVISPAHTVHHIGEGSMEWFEAIDADQKVKFVRFGSHVLGAVVVERPDGSKTEHHDIYKVALLYGYDEEVFDGEPISDAGNLTLQKSEGILRALRVEGRSNMYGQGDFDKRQMTARIISEALPGLIVTTDNPES